MLKVLNPTRSACDIDLHSAPSWQAQLALDFERRGDRSVLAARRHDGPLVVQKTHYPEGGLVCHSIVVHPPGGIAGGDDLQFTARLGVKAHVLLTTPGAGKWYRSAGLLARQSVRFEVGAGACLEWLPQESIIFNGSHADLRTVVHLAKDGRFIGWDITCLGRRGSGESFAQGSYRARTLIERGNRPVWMENAHLDGGGAALQSAAVLAGHSVMGNFLVASEKLDSSVLALCRKLQPEIGVGAVTLLPGILKARYLGEASQAAKRYFVKLWHIVRPLALGRAAVDPRIWQT